MPDKSILMEKIESIIIEITITKEDGSFIKLGDEYKEEYFHGRSAFAKYLTDNNHNSS